ncbi:hypothetical protein RvY_14220 [Ramazzottius varieornatus]|uniref:RRM domain-containing protein n=1 Tax=Ramazzottius varieornatus TaxID=947166 RepID=A0A1D1VQK0_RAMVA|nr:hypothetical protein RvY_14220 [Ramazzottius varieornatus]
MSNKRDWDSANYQELENMNGLLTSPMSTSGTTTTTGATNGVVSNHSSMMNSNNHHNGTSTNDSEQLKKARLDCDGILRDSPGDSSSNSSYLNHNSPGSNGGGDAGERMPNGGSSIQTLGYINGTMSPSSNILTSHPRMSNGMQRQNSNSSTSNGANNRTGSTNQHNVNSPSRVVHIRGIPLEAHEEDIMALGAPFGRISNVLLLKGKNQAFLEMAEESAAIAMVSSYNSGQPCLIKSRPVWIQYSSHKELKTDNASSNNSIRTQAVLKSAMPVMMVQQQSQHLLTGNGSSQNVSGQGNGLPLDVGQNGGSNSSGSYGGINTILRVVVENAMYPVSLDVLHGIFGRFGKVLKIIIFTKNHQFQVLIQYMDRQSASAAKQNLDGQNIYTGCCTLRIDYSRLDNLRVTYNNDKSRDFTNPNLPSGENSSSSSMHNAMGLQDSLAASALHPFQLGPGGGMSHSAAAAASLQAASLLHGFHNGGNGNHNALASMGQNAQVTAQAVYNASILQAGLAAGAFGTRQPFVGTNGHMNGSGMPGGAVLLVSKFDEELVTPDALFTLFGVYGDVTRVKILYNKKDTALVQMADPRGAQLAIMHLDRLKLYGKQMKVSMSKHNEVQMPKEGSGSDSGLTKEYINSPLHRFKKPGSKNYANIYPPSETLHLSNIPPGMSEEEIVQTFVKNGYTPKQIKFFPKDHKMALALMETTEQAVEALIKLHNLQLNCNTHLRVSFSSRRINDVN